MTDRDTFAAAALTGLLMNGDYSTDSIPSLAYSMADAMLRERERNGAVSSRETAPVTEPMPKEKRAEVSEWRSHIRPLDAADRHALQKCDEAWGIVHDAVPAAKSAEPESSVPLGSGAELAHTQEPVAMTTDEIIASLHGQHDRYRGSGTLMEKVLKEAANEIERLREEVAFARKVLLTINAVHAIREAMPPPPLLTDAEREAVGCAVGFCECTTSPLPTSDQIATLRGLLGRLK